MDFLDKISKQASKTYKEVATKTGKLTKQAKLKMLINANKSDIQELYEKIGRKVYEKHVREENIDIKEELLQECSEIDILADEIESARMDILNLRDKKQCDHCYYEIDAEYHYCPNCGEMQEDNEQNLDGELEKDSIIEDSNLNQNTETTLEDEIAEKKDIIDDIEIDDIVEDDDSE